MARAVARNFEPGACSATGLAFDGDDDVVTLEPAGAIDVEGEVSVAIRTKFLPVAQALRSASSNLAAGAESRSSQTQRAHWRHEAAGSGCAPRNRRLLADRRSVPHVRVRCGGQRARGVPRRREPRLGTSLRVLRRHSGVVLPRGPVRRQHSDPRRVLCGGARAWVVPRVPMARDEHRCPDPMLVPSRALRAADLHWNTHAPFGGGGR